MVHCVGIGFPSRIWLAPSKRVSCQILRTDAFCEISVLLNRLRVRFLGSTRVSSDLRYFTRGGE